MKGQEKVLSKKGKHHVQTLGVRKCGKFGKFVEAPSGFSKS